MDEPILSEPAPPSATLVPAVLDGRPGVPVPFAFVLSTSRQHRTFAAAS